MREQEYGMGRIVDMWPLDIKAIGEMGIGEVGYAPATAVVSEYIIDENFRISRGKKGCWENIVVTCVGSHQYRVTFPDLESRRRYFSSLDSR